MKRLGKNSIACLAAMLFAAGTAFAQEGVETAVGADLVSGYYWRGQKLSGVSIQPYASASYKGLSLTAWANVAFTGNADNVNELDFSLSYTLQGLTVGITDYWFGGHDYFHYGAHSTTHVWEANIGYDFGCAAINWYTNFAGCQGRKSNGDYAYSSYFSLSAPFTLGGLEWSAEIGATPWENSFYNDGSNGFAVCDISLGAKKEVAVTDRFSLAMFGKLSVNPATEGAYFTYGIHF